MTTPNLFGLPAPKTKRTAPPAVEVRPSRPAVERAIMEGYAMRTCGAATIAALLEVPTSSAYVALTLGAIEDARRFAAFRGTVPFDEVARLASVVLKRGPVPLAPMFGLFGGESC